MNRAMSVARAAAGLLVLGCTIPSAIPPAAATPAPAVAATRPPDATPALTVRVIEAAYGKIALTTRPGARCDIVLDLAPGRLGDRPPERTSETAGPTGALVWIYAAPPQPTQRAGYSVTCTAGDERAVSTAPFQVTARAPSAAAFTARLMAAEPPGDVRADPSLMPLRDAALVELRSTLAREWAAATRGLGALTLVDEPAEVLIKVIAARSTSVHVTAGDGSQEIRLFVAGLEGPESTENLVAVALHEIGHIWCCRGEGAAPGGHWATAVADPELQGVDRFGLMNHPVRCMIFGTVESCPNRFSRRDLAAFGFTNIPAPPPDPCLSRARPLEVRIGALDATLATTRVAVEVAQATLTAISERLRAIEAQYGRTLPPAVYDEYNALVARYNGMLPAYRSDLAAHNAAVDERNSLVTSRNALAC